MSVESFGERLRRLRRDDPVVPSARSDLEQRIRDDLARRGAKRKRATAPESSDAARDAAASAGAEPTLGLPNDLVWIERGEGTLLVRRTSLAGDHRHGARTLGEIADVEPRSFALLARDPRLADIDLRRALYLDTETSGLAGGSGTYVFMVGLGSFDGGSFEVWQGFLDDPAHERALLLECAERIRAAPAIVSFFGKSFDRHRLEDRMRCLGIEPPFEEKAHLDLYHPLRRLHRGAFADHRLRTLERALCGIERDDDLPGSFAPAAWFDFLAGRPHRLEGVFRHNRDDVLSLVTLAAHLGGALRVQDAGRRSSLCAANLARALSQDGDRRAALHFCDEALRDPELGERRARAARVLRAELLQNCGEIVACIRALRELAREPEDENTSRVLVSLARLELKELGDARAARDHGSRAAVVIACRHTGTERARLERSLATLQTRLAQKRRRACLRGRDSS